MTMDLEFVSTACTDFLGFYSLWMYTLLNLDVVGRALDFPQGRVPYPLLRLDGVGKKICGGSRRSVGISIGIF